MTRAAVAAAVASGLVALFPAPSGATLLGFNDTAETFGRDAHRAAEAGARIARVPVSWELTEPSPGDYDWSDLDAAVESLAGERIRVLFALGTAPEWAAGGCDSTWTATCGVGAGYEDEFARFAQALLARYPGSVAESWNEPDLIQFGNLSARRVAELTRVLYRVAPGRIIGPASSPGNPAQAVYTRRIYRRLPRDVPMAVHLYPRDGRRAMRLRHDWRQSRAIAGSRQVWVTEVGFAEAEYGPRGQARRIVAAYRFLHRRRAEAIIYHRLRDAEASWNDWLGSLGILAVDGTPKPAYRALTRVVRGS